MCVRFVDPEVVAAERTDILSICGKRVWSEMWQLDNRGFGRALHAGQGWGHKCD